MHQSSSSRGRNRAAQDLDPETGSQGHVPSGSNRLSRPKLGRNCSPSLPPLPLLHPLSLPQPQPQPIELTANQAQSTPPSRNDQDARPTQTPSRRRIMEMLGPKNMGEISVIFRELVHILKDLPPGGFDKAYALRPPTSVASKSMSFMWDKQHFKDVVRLAELGVRLAKQAHNPRDLSPDPFVETVLAGMKLLEAKVNQLDLDTANMAAILPAPAKSYATATAGGASAKAHRTKLKPATEGKKPPPALAPLRNPQLMLSQLAEDKYEYVEMSTEAGALASRATSTILTKLRDQTDLTKAGSPPHTVDTRHKAQHVHRRYKPPP